MIKKRRPPRTSKACETCRKRKIKCTGGPVCKECTIYGEVCVFRSQYRSNSTQELNKNTLEIPDYLSVSSQNNVLEYFGSASNYSFVSQLNHFLRQLDKSSEDDDKGLERFGFRPTVIEHTSIGDFSVDSISTETLNNCLIAYLETWAIPFPFFEAGQVFDLASDTWKNPKSTPEDRALLYLILSLGAATSYFDQDSSPNAFPVAKCFFDLALQTLPTVFSQVSFEAVRVVSLMSLCACSLGDTALSYIYSGIAVRILVAIGLHKNSVVKKLRHSLDSRHQRKVWVCVWQFEKYWSFCVGRPSGLSDYIDVPLVRDEDFVYGGYGEDHQFKMSTTHSKLRVKFASFLSKIHAELYNSKNDLLTVLSKVEYFSNEIDGEYFNCDDKQLIQSEVDDNVSLLNRARIIEWFWIRIYYLYIKLIVFRPILIFSAYLENTATAPGMSESLKSKIKAGSDNCVSVAIELSNFIIKLNNKVRMLQPIIFISTYLESTSTVLLFYIVSNLANIPDPLAMKIWNVLQDTRSFLNGSCSYIASTKILAKDGLESLHKLLRSRDNNNSSTYLDRIMKPVTTGSPYSHPLEHDVDAGIEAIWLLTLDWLDYP